MIVVRGGTYAENLTITTRASPSAPFTLRAAAGERVILRARRVARNAIPLQIGPGASYVRVQGLIVEGAVGPSTTNVYVSGSSHHIEISDCEVRDSERQGFFIDSATSNVQILRCSIHDNGTASNPMQDHGVYVEGRDHLIASSVIYDHPNGFGVHVFPVAESVAVVGNTIVGNDSGGVLVGGDDDGAAQGTIVANNVLTDNRGPGVRTFWTGPVGDRNVARANLAFRNASTDFADDGDGIRYDDNFVADPRFTGLEQRDLRLGAGSPALGRAIPELSPRLDADGAPRPTDARPDLGAFERAPDRPPRSVLGRPAETPAAP